MKTFRRTLLLLLLCVALAAGYLLFWPVPIDPGQWNPPASPGFTGDFAPNTALASLERLGEDDGVAPEDIAVDQDGNLYGGFVDGRVVRWDEDGRNPEVLADTEGRPLGLAFTEDGTLVIADAIRGLLALPPEGDLEVWSTEHGNRPFRFVDDVDVAADGTVYFSDASDRFTYTHYIHDIVEHRPNGRLLSYHPERGETTLEVANLFFANGVAVDPRQEFVLVVETGKYRILRYWIATEKAGQVDVFIDNLPAFPDGVSAGGHGIFWVALASPRNDLLDDLMPSPFLRKALLRLPEAARPKPERYGFVLGLDRDGTVVHNLQDPDGAYAPITSAEEAFGQLYFGSILEPGFARIEAPESES